ncbi:MAG: vWA domain-containing protein [Myxococcaceae bacterium]
MNWTAWGLELESGSGREGHLLISVEAAGEEARTPVMVNLLLDRSGSMKGAPLAAAIEAAQQFVELAGPGDFVGLLVFDGVAEQRVPLCAMDARGKRAMIDALAEVEPGRGTALHQAVELGALAVQRLLVPGRRPKLLLLTDGEPSVGADHESAFDSLGVKIAQSGTSVHALGLARHYVAEILSALTLPSGNAFEHVDGPDGLPVAMGAVFAHLFGEVASAAAVRVTPKGFASLGCRHSYPTRTEDDALLVTLGDVSRGLARRVLLSGAIADGGWDAGITGSALERGDQRHQSITLERVTRESAKGRQVVALGKELELVGAETSAWLSLARRDLPRALVQLEEAEKSLRDLVALAVDGVPVRRHLERLGDLRLAIERGEGDIPLLIRRAKSARAGTHVSQVIPLHVVRSKN